MVGRQLQQELLQELHPLFDGELQADAAVIEAIAQEQAQLQFEYYLQDQDSTNHCFVNEEQVKLKKLQHEDVIRIGKNNFRFVDDRNDNLEETTKLHKTWLPGVYVTKKRKK